MNASATSEVAPPPGVLDEVENDFAIRTAVVRAALELGVVPAIAAGHREPATIARSVGASQAGVSVLLEAMCALGLLRRSDGGYSLGPVAAMYLDASSPGYSAPLYLRELRRWDGLVEILRSGSVPNDVGARGDADDVWASYARQQLVAWRASRDVYVRDRWGALGITAATLPAARVLDVCCGPALATLSLVASDPAATLTGVDRPSVLDVAARIAAEMGIQSRVTWVPGDVATLGSLEGPFDVVFFGHILHFLTTDEVASCMAAARGLLAPGGRVVCNELFATPGEYADPNPQLTAVWLFAAAPHGRLYTVEELSGLLAGAGLGPVRRLEGTGWITASPLV